MGLYAELYGNNKFYFLSNGLLFLFLLVLWDVDYWLGQGAEVGRDEVRNAKILDLPSYSGVPRLW